MSEALLQEITSLNHLDVELYKYAQTIFANQHKRMLLYKAVKVSAHDTQLVFTIVHALDSEWNK